MFLNGEKLDQTNSFEIASGARQPAGSEMVLQEKEVTCQRILIDWQHGELEFMERLVFSFLSCILQLTIFQI